MKKIIYECDVCKKPVLKTDCLTMNIFNKSGGQKRSLGSKDICKICYNKIFNKNRKDL